MEKCIERLNSLLSTQKVLADTLLQKSSSYLLIRTVTKYYKTMHTIADKVKKLY